VLPIVETFIYRAVWGVTPRESFPALLKKRIYNQEVLGYSGEAYLFLWARRRLGQRDADLLRAVRDVNILSAVASMLFTIGVIGILFFTGLLDVFTWIRDNPGITTGVAVLIGVSLVVLLMVTRRHFFAMQPRTALVVFLLHLGQVVFIHAMMILQWTYGVPDVPLSVWITFAGITVVMNRIPFLPSKDLVFLGLSVELTRVMDVATASVASMLLVSSVAGKLLNALVLAIVQFTVRDPELERARTEAEEVARLAEALPDEPR
jgi:hypothetical protein